MTQLMPPIPPRAPAPLSENAGNTERADYLARRTAYHAKLRVYEGEVEKYRRQMMQFIDDPEAGQPLQASPVPTAPSAADPVVIEHQAADAPVEQAVEVPDPVLFDFQDNLFLKPADLNPLNLAVGLATAAIAMHIDAGDLRWHGGENDFTWPAEDGTAIPMDAETFVEFARAAHNAK